MENIAEKKAALHAAVVNERDAYTARWAAMIAYRDAPTEAHRAASEAARLAHWEAKDLTNDCRRALGYHVSVWTADPRKRPEEAGSADA